jgi:glycosyltransferase involved in cell wall biosynthesis
MKFSIIVPVYNRPEETQELLQSLTTQTYQNFEVRIIEDGSTEKAAEIVADFQYQLDLHYHYIANCGQGFARNEGFAHAKGDFFIVLDSDCIIPPHYLQTVCDNILKKKLDAYGGPDHAHSSFTPTQKAISYAMTSLFSTGGIRGGAKSAERFRPRSFNMGLSRQVWEKIGGYRITRMGEDIEFSVRMEQAGFKIGLIREAYVYHKRRTNFRQFYKQLHFFGRARINVRRFFRNELKLVHLFPLCFVVFLLSLLVVPLFSHWLWQIELLGLALYVSLIFTDSLARTRNLQVAFLSIGAVLVQLSAYGIGFLTEIFFPLSAQKIDKHKT